MYELLKDLTIMMLEEGFDEPTIHRVLDIIEGDLINAKDRFGGKSNLVSARDKFAERRRLAKNAPKRTEKVKTESNKPIYKGTVHKAEDKFKEQGKKPSNLSKPSDPVKDVIPKEETEAYRKYKGAGDTLNKMFKSGELDHVKQHVDGEHVVGDVKTVQKLHKLRNDAMDAGMKLDRLIYRRTGRDAGYMRP